MYAVAPYIIKSPAGIRRTFGKGAAFIALHSGHRLGGRKTGKEKINKFNMLN